MRVQHAEFGGSGCARMLASEPCELIQRILSQRMPGTLGRIDDWPWPRRADSLLRRSCAVPPSIHACLQRISFRASPSRRLLTR
jgi:hypothetical protein